VQPDWSSSFLCDVRASVREPLKILEGLPIQDIRRESFGYRDTVSRGAVYDFAGRPQACADASQILRSA
jgi:hypothetical protein